MHKFLLYSGALILLCLSSYAQPNPINRRAMAIAGLAQGPFSINNTPGLVLYFTSDVNVTNSSNTSPPNENDTISRWGNQINITGLSGGNDNGDVRTNSGFAIHAPHYHTNGPNGQPFISFTNTASPTMLQCSPNQPTFVWPDTLFVVSHTAHTGTTPQIFWGAASSTTYEQCYLGASYALNVQTDGGTTLTSFTTPTTWYLITVMFNSAGNLSLIRSNGTQITTGTFTTGNHGILWGNIGCNFDQQFPSQVDYAAFVFATNNLNNFGSVGAYWMTNVENSLMTKYGISH